MRPGHLSASSIKENMVFRPVLPQDEWKVSFVKELIMIRSHDMMIENLENIELDDILDMETKVSIACKQ